MSEPAAARGPDLAALLSELPDFIVDDEAVVRRCQVGGRVPSAVALPRNPEEVVRALQVASSQGLAVTPWGGGTAAADGPPPNRLDLALSLERMSRVVDHQPGDMTVTVQAGVTLGHLQAALAAAGQRLPLDPPFAGSATLGGIAAANAWGPLRHAFGRPRDLVLGMTVVTAEGEVVRAGGRVVKNVAGYDLNKLFIGSLGTLGVITEVTLKVWPLAECRRDLVAKLGPASQAEELLAAVLGSQLLPARLDMADAVPAKGPGALPLVLIAGFEGTSEIVEWQVERLQALGRELGAEWHALSELESARLSAWESTALPPDPPEFRLVVRVSGLSGDLRRHWEALRSAASDLNLACAAYSFAGCGVTLACCGEPEPGAAPERLCRLPVLLREHLSRLRARVTVEQARGCEAEALQWWEPDGPPGKDLALRIKSSLDPKDTLNPGVMPGVG
ncbi:MAG TPA: FAD-binding oxidoreductase [Armatimonadota bacterium]